MINLFSFQSIAVKRLLSLSRLLQEVYRTAHTPQVLSFTAPTGSGKTVMMADFIDKVIHGGDGDAGLLPPQDKAVFVWLSDSPQLNEQSMHKIQDLWGIDTARASRLAMIDECFDRETLSSGMVYFLNTQKLGLSSRLVQKSEMRHWTIWETLANTARKKGEMLYFIIDEAHRGTAGRLSAEATTIMQKFIKGSEADGIEAMPLVIGMSATLERFNNLVGATTSGRQSVDVKTEDVRQSGLLKDRIFITYPSKGLVQRDMSMLDAAARDWQDKCQRWEHYCVSNGVASVRPALIVQVENSTHGEASDTDLGECVKVIEAATGYKFGQREVCHAFGQPKTPIDIKDGKKIVYCEPSQIAQDEDVRVVFFKDSLSTGWDCPRAETMMSFRRAVDATYIAQLLGRMVRTPLQHRVESDDVLNAVRLFLPHFDEDTVADIVNSMQDVPTDVDVEEQGKQKCEVLTTKPRCYYEDKLRPAGQADLQGVQWHSEEGKAAAEGNTTEQDQGNMVRYADDGGYSPTKDGTDNAVIDNVKGSDQPSIPPVDAQDVLLDGEVATALVPTAPKAERTPRPHDTFDRRAVVDFIDGLKLPTYTIATSRINNYVTSLTRLSSFLLCNGLDLGAEEDYNAHVADMIEEYIEQLKQDGRYEAMQQKVVNFELFTKSVDSNGKTTGEVKTERDVYHSVQYDVDRCFDNTDGALGRNGAANTYLKRHWTDENEDVMPYQADVILFTADEQCLRSLHDWAQKRFNELHDHFRPIVAGIKDEAVRREYDAIVIDSDVVTKHTFRLPDTIVARYDDDGAENAYQKHLFVNDKSGTARINLNGWERPLIEEEMQSEDFVCFLRNSARASWALCLARDADAGERKPFYPDFIIVRKDAEAGYILDILEPHRPDLFDNVSKAKALAQYAAENPIVRRVQLVRMTKDAIGAPNFIRLDMTKSEVRQRIKAVTKGEELDHLFEENTNLMTN